MQYLVGLPLDVHEGVGDRRAELLPAEDDLRHARLDLLHRRVLYRRVLQLGVLEAGPGGRDLEPAVPQVGPGGVLERDVELEVREVVAVVVEEGEEASLEGQLCKLFKLCSCIRVGPTGFHTGN